MTNRIRAAIARIRSDFRDAFGPAEVTIRTEGADGTTTQVTVTTRDQRVAEQLILDAVQKARGTR